MTTFNDGYDVGDIVDDSWGYDQTNVDFYQIVRRTKQTVWLVPMTKATNETGFMQGRTIPLEPKPDATPLRRKLKSWDGKIHGLQIESYGWCSAWDGSAQWTSWYA